MSSMHTLDKSDCQLVCFVGLPRSGKSTIAREYIKKGGVVVDTDAIRMTLFGHSYWESAEAYVFAIARTMIDALFNAGHKLVILDTTNLKKKDRNHWRKLGYKIKFVVVPTAYDVCVERAKSTGQDYLIPVIKTMSEGAEWPDPGRDYEYIELKENE